MGRRKEERRWAWLPALHHRPSDRGPFQANSCLRWVFGKHLSSVSEVCPYCNGRALSCRGVLSADCPDRIRQEQEAPSMP
ncbi:hypothetical protein [Streptomyces sp. 8N616]|uniref:hypothetical protein n=1 Tax=Streptomyces sp. 8N616 TaxID=3457414 RepID=UPI003FD13749